MNVFAIDNDNAITTPVSELARVFRILGWDHSRSRSPCIRWHSFADERDLCDGGERFGRPYKQGPVMVRSLAQRSGSCRAVFGSFSRNRDMKQMLLDGRSPG